MKVNNKKDCLIYFHGNAEDIGNCINFLIPIQRELDINMYALEYPTYGVYKEGAEFRISDQIKTDSLDFFKHLQ